MVSARHILNATSAALWLCSCAYLQETNPALTLSDRNLISVLDSLGRGEIDTAQLAAERASSPEVKAFAARVLNEHRLLMENSERIAGQLSLDPKPPALAAHLRQAHEHAMRELRGRSGSSFDRAYLEHEIQQHVHAFNFIEAAAEPQVNPLLRQEIVRTGPDLLSHLSAAKALERRLGPETPDTIAVR